MTYHAKTKISAKEIQLSRRDWYAYHYEKRAKFKALGTHEQHIYMEAAMKVSPPAMTIYGGFMESWPNQEETRMLGRTQGLIDFDLACPWYVSDYGWQTFQELWKQLPEPVDSPTGHLWAESAVIHTAHKPAELSPIDRA